MPAPAIGMNVSANVDGTKYKAQIRAVNKDGTVDLALFEPRDDGENMICSGASGLTEATDPKEYGNPNVWWR